MSVFVTDPKSITLGNQEFKVRPLKWKRLIPMKEALLKLFRDFDEAADLRSILIDLFPPPAPNDAGKETEAMRQDRVRRASGRLFEAFSVAFDQLKDSVVGVLVLAIPELEKKRAIFADDAPEEENPDVEQVLMAIDAALDANHLQALKNLFRGQETTT